MPTTLTPVDELRALADKVTATSTPVPKGLRLQLKNERLAHLETMTRTRQAAEGRDYLASEQRDLTRVESSIIAIDRVLLAAEQRDNDFYSVRSNNEHLFTATAVRTETSNPFGDQLAQAILEVRDGRATAFVDAPEVRTLTEAGPGGFGVNTQLLEPVSKLAARSVVMSLPGLRTEPMTSDRVRWPRIGAATVAGVAEAATLTAANTDVDGVDVAAQKFGTIEYLSTELEEDMSASALAVFGENLLKYLALKVDYGLLEGLGNNDAVGIRNVTGANSTSVAGTPASFAKFRTAEYELRLDNGEPRVWVMHPRTWNTLAGIKTGISSDETTLLEPNPQQGPRTLLGYPVAFSTQITLTEGTNGSWVALLDTSQLIVCERRPARLEVSRDFTFDTDRIAIRATWRGNLAALNPEAISLLTDVRA